MKSNALIIRISLGLALTCVPCFSQETATVKKDRLPLHVNIPGVFVADAKDEIKMEPNEYRGELIVTRILAEGESVKKGDVLIEFDADKLVESIEDAENEATDASVELKKASAQFESAKIDLESKQSQLKTELAFLRREAEATVAKQTLELAKKEDAIVDSEYSLANTRTDLETLKKIYNERNLQTSTSGDILLAREAATVANQEAGIVVQRKELDYFKKFDKSKDTLNKELAIEKKMAEIKKQKVNLEAAVAEKQSVVEKAQRKLDKANEKVSGLKIDQRELRVIAPRDGILFYGTTGQELPAGVFVFGGMPDVRDELRVGGRVKTHSILLTVAAMDSLSIKMSISEDDIQHLKRGLKITVYPDAFPKSRFQGSLTKVGQIATKIGFDMNSPRRFKVIGACTDDAPMLRSGMSCRVSVQCEEIENAILVPVQCVFKHDDQFVCYIKNGAEPEMRVVQIGFSNPEFAQVTDGLTEGEEIYLQKPKMTPGNFSTESH